MRPTFKSKSVIFKALALKSGEFTIGGFSNQRPVGCLSIPFYGPGRDTPRNTHSDGHCDGQIFWNRLAESCWACLDLQQPPVILGHSIQIQRCHEQGDCSQADKEQTWEHWTKKACATRLKTTTKTATTTTTAARAVKNNDENNDASFLTATGTAFLSCVHACSGICWMYLWSPPLLQRSRLTSQLQFKKEMGCMKTLTAWVAWKSSASCAWRRSSKQCVWFVFFASSLRWGLWLHPSHTLWRPCSGPWPCCVWLFMSLPYSSAKPYMTMWWMLVPQLWQRLKTWHGSNTLGHCQTRC